MSNFVILEPHGAATLSVTRLRYSGTLFPKLPPTSEEARFRNLVTRIPEVIVAVMINIVVLYVLTPYDLLGGYQQKISRPTRDFKRRDFIVFTH